MASSPAAVRPTISGRSNKTLTTTTTIAAPFVRTVFVHNWWLINVEMDSKGRRGLGVAGFEDREGQGTRAFFSAAIVKRHDTVTLETADGITITLIGFINRSLTAKNGSPSEVGNRFRFGFPHNWEEYAGRFCGEESGNGPIPSKFSNLDGLDISSVEGTYSSPPICLDDLPVTCVRDLLMSSGADSGVLEKSILNDIMKYFEGNEAIGNEKGNNNYGAHSLMTRNFVPKQVPRNHDKNKVDDKCKGDGSSQHSSDRGKLKFSKIAGECETGMDVDSLSGGVMTRSMSRLCNLRNKQENNLSPRTYVARRLTEVSGDRGLTVDKGDGSSKRPWTVVSNSEVEGNGTPCTFTPTRFSRPESLSKSEDNRYGGVLSGKEMNVKQIPDKFALRRSGRLRKIYN